MAAVVLLVASTSTAQDASTEANRAGLIRQATQARDAGDHAQAFDLAVRAGGLRWTASLRWMAAGEAQALGRLSDALGYATLCAREARSDATVQQRDVLIQQCDGMVRELQERVAHIRVRIPDPAPAGLRVRVGERDLAAELYNAPTVVDPGTITVRATAEGHEPFERQVTLTVGASAEVTVQLEPTRNTATTPAPPPVPTTRGISPGPFVAAGLGVLGFITAGIVYSFRESAVTQLNGMCQASMSGVFRCTDSPALQAAMARADALNTGTNATLGIASVLVGVGVVWFIIDRATARRDRAGLRLAPTFAVTPGEFRSGFEVAF